jgi:hypothetical protein
MHQKQGEVTTFGIVRQIVAETDKPPGFERKARQVMHEALDGVAINLCGVKEPRRLMIAVVEFVGESQLRPNIAHAPRERPYASQQDVIFKIPKHGMAIPNSTDAG